MLEEPHTVPKHYWFETHEGNTHEYVCLRMIQRHQKHRDKEIMCIYIPKQMARFNGGDYNPTHVRITQLCVNTKLHLASLCFHNFAFGKYIFLCFHNCGVCTFVFPQKSSVHLCVNTKLHKFKKSLTHSR